MKFYTVLMDPARTDPDDRILLVREGFNSVALVAPLLWLIYRRAWLGVLAYLVAAAGIVGLLALLGTRGEVLGAAAGALLLGFPGLLISMPAPLPAALGGLFALLCAFEAHDVWRYSLAGRGYQVVAVVAGRTLVEAEQAYFGAKSLPDYQGNPVSGGAGQSGSRPAIWTKPDEAILGLFPGADRRP